MQVGANITYVIENNMVYEILTNVSSIHKVFYAIYETLEHLSTVNSVDDKHEISGYIYKKNYLDEDLELNGAVEFLINDEVIGEFNSVDGICEFNVLVDFEPFTLIFREKGNPLVKGGIRFGGEN